jgi:hypothetical protein
LQLREITARNRRAPRPIEAPIMVTASSSIFRDDRPRTSLGAPRPPTAPTIAIRPPSAVVATTADGKLIAVLDSPLGTTENAFIGFARKERELSALFASLSVLECRLLHKRLANPQHGDELANKFARLTLDRRARLLTFLADARRREAIAANRKGSNV